MRKKRKLKNLLLNFSATELTVTRYPLALVSSKLEILADTVNGAPSIRLLDQAIAYECSPLTIGFIGRIHVFDSLTELIFYSIFRMEIVLQTSILSLNRLRIPCMPNSSWFTSITSLQLKSIFMSNFQQFHHHTTCSTKSP